MFRQVDVVLGMKKGKRIWRHLAKAVSTASVVASEDEVVDEAPGVIGVSREEGGGAAPVEALRQVPSDHFTEQMMLRDSLQVLVPAYRHRRILTVF